MSSVPNEVLEYVLQPLDRWTLDAAQFTNRRFLQLIMKRMSDVCLRKIEFANFTVTNASSVGVAEYAVRIDGRPVRRDSAAYYIADLFSEFLHLLRGSSVAYLYLWGLVLTPELLARVTQAPIVAGTLTITGPGCFDVAGSCAELSPSQFHELLLHFSPTSLDIGGCRLRACQLTDGLLYALSKNRMRRVVFPHSEPVDDGSFAVTDEAIVNFCVQQDPQVGQEGDIGELHVRNGSFTKDLFKRLVEASSMSMRTQPLRISVSPLPIKEEDLDAFAQHLSYRESPRRPLRIYEFPAKQHEQDAAMHTQIVLLPGIELEMNRARRPSSLFRAPGE